MKIRVYLCSIFLLLSPGLILAQQNMTSATLSGRIEDTRGASVSGASVVATHLESNQQLTTGSDQEGRFRFPYLRTGTYEIKIDAAGFTGKPPLPNLSYLVVALVLVGVLFLAAGAIGNRENRTSQEEGLELFVARPRWPQVKTIRSRYGKLPVRWKPKCVNSETPDQRLASRQMQSCHPASLLTGSYL